MYLKKSLKDRGKKKYQAANSVGVLLVIRKILLLVAVNVRDPSDSFTITVLSNG
jgi:hypothetical protein